MSQDLFYFISNDLVLQNLKFCPNSEFFKLHTFFLFFQKFTEGYCIYEGDLLENAIDINDVTACQFLCQVDSLCNYFVYNADELNCQLLSSPSRTCDLIRGPPTPTLNDCSIDPSNHKTYFEKNIVLITCFQRFQVIPKTYFDKKRMPF